MDLTRYVDSLREELAVVAEAGGAEARSLAERLTAPLESAVRLMLLDALSAAASEITRELAPGSVDVRLRGRDPEFAVTAPPAGESFDGATDGATMSGPVATGETDEGAVARINFRVPETLKLRIEEAAGRDGLSVNAWLVRLTSAAVEHDGRSRRPKRGGNIAGQHYTGWVR
jgi:hypothetical protein